MITDYQPEPSARQVLQLAAILYGDPKADLYNQCCTVLSKKEPGRVLTKDRGDNDNPEGRVIIRPQNRVF